MSLLFATALVVLLVHLYTLADVGLGLMKMGRLRDIAPRPPKPAPLVSVIVPACNEAQTIEPALKALLLQDYPNLEIVVVNDRSTDDTGSILLRMQQQSDKPFTIRTIERLPSGWLGKSHALTTGAKSASGEILLFTDADIEMEKTTISRAVAVMEGQRLDHLSLIFQTVGGNWLLNGMILDAGIGLLALFRPWKARDTKSRHFMGVGAFNMVRTNTYRAVGGHDGIRMHPIDDIMLGKIIKEQGFHQMCLLGQPLVRVSWYASVPAMVEGLMKNVFALFHYRAWLALLSMAVVIALTILPVFGMLWATGATRLLFAAAVLLRLSAFAVGAVVNGMHLTAAVGSLLSPFMSIFIIARATFLTLKRGGIIWRGSFYSLAELRKSRSLIF
jgi:glycosyltransferase involved in cell wall biosynthesis